MASHFFRQTASLTSAAIRSVPQRLGASLVTVVGITTVMAVLVSMLSLGQGVGYLAQTGARPEHAVVISRGAQSSLQSSIPRDWLGIASNAPGIKKDARGQPIVAGGLIFQTDAKTRNNQRASMGILGMGSSGLEFWSYTKIIEGRRFQPGLHELNISAGARARFKDHGLGDRIRIRGTDWTIVGVYTANGGFLDSAAIADADTLMSVLQRTAYSALYIVMDSPASFPALKRTLESDATLQVDVKTESDNNAQATKTIQTVLDYVSYFIGGIMGIGAVCGALASLYAAVDTRRREIATLRAIGFSAGPVVISVLAEGLALAIPSALLGAAIAWFLFNGHVVAALQISFPLVVTAASVTTSIFWAISIALLGGLLPAIRAARLPVATALRAT
jgi:putative ABC transport system permease protein